MRGWVVALALCASLALFVLELVVAASPTGLTAWAGASGVAFEPRSRVGWVALVWCAALSFGRDPVGRRARGGSLPSELATALPVFALAFASDVREGSDPVNVAALGALALATFVAWSAALARGSTTFSAAAWSVVALGAPLLVAALEWGGAAAEARAPVWLRAIASASPLAWCHALAAGALPDGWRAAPLAPFAAACAVAVFAGRFSRDDAPPDGGTLGADDSPRSNEPGDDVSGASTRSAP